MKGVLKVFVATIILSIFSAHGNLLADPIEVGAIRTIPKGVYWAFFIIFLGSIVSLIIMNIELRKEPEPKFTRDYFPGLPGDYTPAEVSFLMGKGQKGANALIGTLIDLLRKGHLNITEVVIFEPGSLIRPSKKVKKYQLSSGKKPSQAELASHEEFLKKWFLAKLGDGEGLILDDLKDQVKVRYDALEFRKNFNVFWDLVEEKVQDKDFFTSKKSLARNIFLAFALGLSIIGIIFIAFFKSWFLGLLSLFLALLFPINMVKLGGMRKYSSFGIEEVAKWKAFRRFLLNFSSLDGVDIPSIKTWEIYLVYASVLGVAKEVASQLPGVFTSEDLKDPTLSYLGQGAGFHSFEASHELFTQVSETIHLTVQVALGGVSKLPV